MIDLAGQVAVSSIGWLVIALASSVCCALLYPFHRALTGAIGPAPRATGIAVFALLPPATATLVIALLNNPDLISVLLPAHCHGDMCAPHAPELAASAGVGAALVAALTAAVATFVWVLHLGLQKQLQRNRILDALSAAPVDDDYRIVESAEPLAWCSGLLRPQIYVSRGLLERLDARQFLAVLAHEKAHVLRRDNLRKLLLHWITLFWPASIRRQLEADFSAACEQLCDRIAANEAGDHSHVVEAIRQLRAAIAPAQGKYAAAFAAHFTDTRIAALSATPVQRRFAIYGGCLIAVIWVAQVGLLTRVAHPALEWLAR